MDVYAYVVIGVCLAAALLFTGYQVGYMRGTTKGMERARQHQANRLRERGRLTDAHPEASGPPSRNGRIRVTGVRPELPGSRPTRRM